MRDEILELKLKGYCCSQIILSAGLKRLDKENEDLITAARGLCGDLGSDKRCGILTASEMYLHLAGAVDEIDDLEAWFEDMHGSKFCDGILQGNPMNKMEKCPAMMENTLNYLADILEWDE